MKKLFTVILVCLIMLHGNIKIHAKDNKVLEGYSKENFITIFNKGKKIQLSLDDITKRIQEDNLEIKLLKEKLSLINKMYDRHLDIAQSLDNERDISKHYYDVEFRKKQKLYYKQTALESDNIEHEIQEKLKEIKTGLKAQYLIILNAKKSMSNMKNVIGNIDNHLKKVQALIYKGVGKEKDIALLKIQKSQVQASLNVLKLKEQEALFRVKQFLGIDLNDNLQFNLLHFNIPFIKYDDKNIESLINKAIENNYELKKKNEQLKHAKLERDIYEVYGRNTQDNKSNIQLKIKDIEDAINEYKLNLNINLWSAYHNLKNNEDLVLVEKVKLQQKSMEYNEAKLRYDKGLMDKISFNLKQLDYEAQENKYNEVVNKYMIIVDRFKNLLE